MKTIKNPYYLFIILFSSSLVLFFQNCGSSRGTEFTKIEPPSKNGFPDFNLVYTSSLNVGENGTFSAEPVPDSFVIESVEWSFSDGEQLQGTIVSKQFNSIGTVLFNVKAKFVGYSDPVEKKNLSVQVLDLQNGSCLDLNNMQILSDLVDFSQENPSWNLSSESQSNIPLAVRLNFSVCMDVHLYNVIWHVYSIDDLSHPVFSYTGHDAHIDFKNAGKYKIEAQVEYGNHAKIHSASEIIDVVSGTNFCKPEEGIYSDRSLANMPAGTTVEFGSLFPTCLGYSGKISWYINDKLISSEPQFSHTFTEDGKFTVRADAEKSNNEKPAQYFLSGNVLSKTYDWFCGSCGGKLECRESVGNTVVDDLYCQEKPKDNACTDVCIDPVKQ